MGGSSSSTTTKIPKEVRERGTKITNAAMGSYFDPGQRYTGFNYGGQGATGSVPSGPEAGNYDWSGVGQATTGQLNGYHQYAGNQITNSGSSYQPYYDAATNLAGSAQGFQANASTANPSVNASWTGNNDVNSGTNIANQYGAQGTSGINPNTGQTWDGSQYNVSGPNFSQANLQQFMNPYTEAVTNQGIRQIGDAMTQRRLEDQSRAGLAGAFGGTRHAVLDNLNASSAMQTLSDFVGTQNANNYNQAVNQFNTNFGQGLQAAGQNFSQGLQNAGFNNSVGQQNWQNQMAQLAADNAAAGQNFGQQYQQAGFNNAANQQNYANAFQAYNANNAAQQANYANYLQALGLNNAAAGQNFGQAMQGASFLQGMGGAQQDAALQSADAAIKLGNIYTAQDEAQKQNAYQYGYLDARNYPLEVYERLAGINAAQPVNRTSTTSQSGGWLGPAIGAVGSIMASDETAKEDIRDRDPEEVLGAFAQVRPKTYAYTDEARKALPETTADGERRGFLAQDYAKAFKRKNPVVGGYQHIDIPNVLGDLVAAVHGLNARTEHLAPKKRKAKNA